MLRVLLLVCLMMTFSRAASSLFRETFCSNVLGLSKDSDRECEKAANLILPDGSNAEAAGQLLCCVGLTSPTYPLNEADRQAYKNKLELDLIGYITFIKDDLTLDSMLRFLAKCTPKLPVGGKLKLSNYTGAWAKNGSCF